MEDFGVESNPNGVTLRDVQYHGIDFQLTWKWHLQTHGLFKVEYSNSCWIDNDYLNIHISTWAEGHSYHARDLAEAQIDDQLMVHLAMPKDMLDTSFSCDFDKMRGAMYTSEFRQQLLDYYREHGYITQDQEDSWMDGHIDEHSNEHINLNDSDMDYVDKLYNDEHNDFHGQFYQNYREN